ncbi:DUF169 domain-containing protein [Methanobacterium alcaliphilum]|uniref:DUF169 domain-containing protein n=1 Tax=Methanobacterium alcaliphilum TaxID=392018 RepID=UPI00200A8F7D|nr:DUF169 domain-containing protein [Methanobacterium alcaliphilum]MCK9151108.1 DUF169 domain-containing protein [Methanobacterium alcaliphilum]
MKNIEESLIRAGNLNVNPLTVYGADEIPAGAVPMCSIDTCVAKGILMAALDDNIPALYIGKDSLKGCCLGAMSWLGFVEPNKYIKYFVSTGHDKFRKGEAEYLKASPEIFEKWKEYLGEINTPGKYLVISKVSDLSADSDIKSFVCFGNGESIRNLSSLIHFRSINPFNVISMPMGPACATLVTYPARMAENTPKGMVFVGPVDPTGNSWFPADYMAMGIPLDMAIKINEDLENSFVNKRPNIAYPKQREHIID